MEEQRIVMLVINSVYIHIRSKESNNALDFKFKREQDLRTFYARKMGPSVGR